MSSSPPAPEVTPESGALPPNEAVTAPVEPEPRVHSKWRDGVAIGVSMLVVGFIYHKSNPVPNFAYDQPFTIAKAMLEGRLGVPDPRPWLELVPGIDEHYSVFPLGGVLCALPLALAHKAKLFVDFPASAQTAFQGATITLFALLMSGAYGVGWSRRLLLMLFLLFGNWMWCNVAFGGAWQFALGFAVIGQLGALYFLLGSRRPLVAGFFYALSFGNRTELVLLGPLFLVFVWLSRGKDASTGHVVREAMRFSVFPILLAGMTLAYNFARFGDVTEMGYERIPFVHDQLGFEHGLLSLKAIPMNARAMLVTTWAPFDEFPYYRPNGFGESILSCCPFLVFLLRVSWRSWRYAAVAWVAIAIATFALWIHGNTGGYQYSYRYAMVLLPWMYWLLLESSPKRRNLVVQILEWLVLAASILISGFAVYAFYWAKYV